MKHIAKNVKWVGMVIALALLFTIPVYAANIPEPSGIVTDPVGLFSKSEVQQIDQALKDRDYTVLLLTAEGLSEREGEQLANDVYDGWGLKADELILVVTVNPNFVHLVYDSSVLSEQVANSDARDAKGIIDRTFVPLASDGRVAEGVIAVSDYVNALAPLVPETPPPVQQPNEPSVQPEPQQPAADSSKSSGKRLSSSSLRNFFIALGACVAALFAINKGMNVTRMKRRIKDLQLRHSNASSSLSKLMVSPWFKELENGFIQGETARQMKKLDEAVMVEHKHKQHLSERLSGLKVPVFGAAKAGQTIDQLSKDVEAFAAQVEELEKELSSIDQLSKEVRRTVEETKSRSQAVQASIDSLSNDYSFSLQALRKEYELAHRSLNEADALDEFDFVQAERFITKAVKQFDDVSESVKHFHEYIEACRNYPQQIDACRRELQQKIDQEQLLLYDDNPFIFLEYAESELTKLDELISTGNIKAIKSAFQRMEQNIDKAKSTVDQIIKQRDEAKATVQKVEMLLAELSGFEKTHRKELEQLDANQTESYYVRIIHHKQQLDQLKEDIKAALDAQQYKQASELSEQAGAVMLLIRKLEQERQEVLQSFNQWKKEYETRLKRYGKNVDSQEYSNNYSGYSRSIERLILAGLFTQAFMQINAGNSMMRRMDQEYQNYLAAERLRRQEEERLRRLEQERRRREEQERRRRQEEERRRREERQRRNSGGGGGFGGGGFGGGGRSGGSSSWGGGSRSSGSSGWGGSSGRSGGSSGWGGGRSGGGRSGGGRSSGSSKW